MFIVEFPLKRKKARKTVPVFRALRNWSQRGDSNLRPAHYECAALPTELHWRRLVAGASPEPGLRGARKKTLAARYSPAADCRSTLAVGALHFRVRNGIGCCLPAMATKERSTEEEDSLKTRGNGFETKRNEQASRTISIGRVSASPHVRLQPIEVVVFHRP